MLNAPRGFDVAVVVAVFFVVGGLAGCVPALVGRNAPASSSASSSSPTSASAPASPAAPDDRASGAVPMQVITLPDVVGMVRADAEAAMRNAGVRGALEVDHDDPRIDYKIAKACNQNPGGGQQTSASLQVAIRYCMPEVAQVEHRTVLVGLDPDEATKRARVAGFTGQIEIQSTNSAGCKVGTVCAVDPDRWELNQSHRMTLWVNKAMTISVPD